jgi:hypothetical protein
MAETTNPETKTAEPQANCPVCNKHLKKKTRYYRNGKYYCDKKCWKKAAKAKAKPEEKSAG